MFCTGSCHQLVESYPSSWKRKALRWYEVRSKSHLCLLRLIHVYKTQTPEYAEAVTYFQYTLNWKLPTPSVRNDRCAHSHKPANGFWSGASCRMSIVSHGRKNGSLLGDGLKLMSNAITCTSERRGSTKEERNQSFIFNKTMLIFF